MYKGGETIKTQRTLNVTCINCKEHHQIEVYEEDYVNWENGMLIQEALPYVDPDTRELLISGMCGRCMEVMFGDF